jgi:hypothetical protein
MRMVVTTKSTMIIDEGGDRNVTDNSDGTRKKKHQHVSSRVSSTSQGHQLWS